MKWALVALLCLAVSPFAGIGQTYLDNVPTYHGPATFHWTLTKKPRFPTLGVFCSQDGGFRYIAELGVSQALTGSATITIENETSSAMPGRLDYTRPASCQAFLWDERLVSQNKDGAIADQVFWTVQP